MKIYLFDIDGTLTESRKKISSEFVYNFLNWMNDKNVYLVTGSDKPKVSEQLPQSIISRCKGVFTCMANELWIQEKLEYKNNFTPPKTLIEQLSSFQIKTKSPSFALGKSPFFEYRTGMLNFTTIGRNCTQRQRDVYYEWDNQNQERKSIVKKLSPLYKELEFKIGGQISIDIQPKGANKSQATKWLRNKFKNCEFVFFGDRCFKDGNDYDIVLDIEKNKDGKWFNVESPKDTQLILQHCD
mgnify:CR=1 FL=1